MLLEHDSCPSANTKSEQKKIQSVDSVSRKSIHSSNQENTKHSFFFERIS